MKKVSFLLILLIVLVAALPASGQNANLQAPNDVLVAINAAKGQTVNYIVLMQGDPVVAYEGDIAGLAATKPGNGEKINPNSAHVKKYVAYLESTHNNALNAVGAANSKKYDYHYSFNGFSAELTAVQLANLKAQPDVLYVWEDEERFSDTSTTPDFLGLTAEGGLWDMGVVGEDVIIGIVDSGIWPENPSFTDRTGTSPSGMGGKLGYHQIPGWHGKCTPGEEFNGSMCNHKLIGAQYFNEGYGGNEGIDATRPWEFNSPRDYNGHGTHTASTSGGNSGVAASVGDVDLGAINGMAPRARISAYKALWSNEDASQASGFTIDLVAAIDQAVADGVDVINYSVSGSRTSFLDSVEVAFLYAADAGIFVATSAGNSGPYASTVAHNSPWLTTVAAGTHDRFYGGTVALGDGSSYSGASIDSVGAGPAPLVYSANVGLTGADAEEVRLCYPGTLDPAAVTGNIVVCDRGAIARVDKSLAVSMASGAGMVLANVAPSSINADLHYVPTVHVDDIDGAVIRAYAQTSGATATLTGGVFEVAEAPFIASFSSRGPALASDDLLKPDIMAPGVDILAAVAPPGNGGRDFDFYSGTSMSSPHIAGIAALMMDAHPDWSPAMIKSALMTTASQETNLGNPISGDPFGYGAGHVTPNSATNPGLVYDAGWNDWLGFLCGTGELIASYCPDIVIDPSDLNYPSITIGELAGVQTVVRTVTNVDTAGAYHVSVDAPAGVDVTVSPHVLILAAGESASYEVTFISTSTAVLDEYVFGSLTWTHGQHSVRSPLAVKPVALAAPSAVAGAGTSGSLSFDVTFGFSGEYIASPQGLVPADLQADTVEDDPADDINAALATCDWNSFPYQCVGITWHEVVVPVDSAYARFSLFDDFTDGADDLDLYVWGPGFFGSSGSGTSAEEVDALLPAPGVYEVAVHGWGTDGPDANYTLFSWVFGPDTGNMTVSAPAAVTLGATETVTVDWAGLTAGDKYLGAISHSNVGGVVGMTLVGIATD